LKRVRCPAGCGRFSACRLRGRPALLAFALLLTVFAALPARGARPVDGTPPPPRLQDSLRLNRLTSAALPPDGLLAVGLGARLGSTVYLLDGYRVRIPRREIFLQGEWSPLPWLQGWVELPWQTWSEGLGWVPVSGSGVGDGLWQVVAGRSLVGGVLHLAAMGGGNLPTGNRSAGLGEGVFSPRAGLAATVCVWRGALVPEMRVHLNATRSWNRNEDAGYGWGTTGFEPWPTRYPAAAAVDGPGGNDATTLGAALEFRRGSSALWVEYSRDRFPSTPAVSPREQFSGVGAGLRWGLTEGWALGGSYLVSLARDDATTTWYPAFPDWSMSVAISRQFSLGGRDRDGDGIVDRRDRCRGLAEDLDGFRDDDGCPDLDNDGDGVPDVRDLAPNAPEDRDGFADLDGAPDPDNDGDGVPDFDDLCPGRPEDLDGDADEDGCPEEVRDRDRDGVPDDRDACPDLPEDLDGFGDKDGCPDPDNDLDGVNDVDDVCPDLPEDYNGTTDEDGCPDEGRAG
jgi:hypothetical protein